MKFCVDIFRIRQEHDNLKQNIDFIFDVDDDLPDLLISDVRLKQVIINLLSNSYKFTFNGYIKLAVHRIISNEMTLLRFLVEDSGLGIPLKYQNELLISKRATFELFDRQNSNSSGFGLQIVQNIINNFESKINFFSREESGTRFWFDLKYQKCEFRKIRFHSRKNTLKLNHLELNLSHSQKSLIYSQAEISENKSNFKIDIDQQLYTENKEIFSKQCNEDSFDFELDKTLPSIKSINIIVFDDEDFIRIAHMKLLRKLESSISFKFNILEARNRIEVLWQIYQSVINENTIKGILIDENMPFMKGSLCIWLVKLMMNLNQLNN